MRARPHRQDEDGRPPIKISAADQLARMAMGTMEQECGYGIGDAVMGPFVDTYGSILLARRKLDASTRQVHLARLDVPSRSPIQAPHPLSPPGARMQLACLDAPLWPPIQAPQAPQPCHQPPNPTPNYPPPPHLPPSSPPFTHVPDAPFISCWNGTSPSRSVTKGLTACQP